MHYTGLIGDDVTSQQKTRCQYMGLKSAKKTPRKHWQVKKPNQPEYPNPEDKFSKPNMSSLSEAYL